MLARIGSGQLEPDAAKAKVEFSVKGPLGTVHGAFTGLKATIQFDVKDPGAGSITASIDANTVSTGIGMRNHHLKSEEQFLNTDKYPLISFHSKKIEKTGSGFTASGDLTIKGVSKPVQIPFTFTPGGNSGVFKGQFGTQAGRLQYWKTGWVDTGDDVTDQPGGAGVANRRRLSGLPRPGQCARGLPPPPVKVYPELALHLERDRQLHVRADLFAIYSPRFPGRHGFDHPQGFLFQSINSAPWRGPALWRL